MPAKDNPQALVKDDDISTEPLVLTLNSEVAAGVDDWLVASTSTTENEVTAINDAVGVGITAANNAKDDQIVPAINATDNKAVTSTNSEENEVTATMGILEDDHEEEFLASTSSCHPKGSHDVAESEEEVEDEILESVSAVLLKIKNNFNSLTLFLFLELANCYSARDGRMARGLQRLDQLGRVHHLLPRL